MRRAPAFDAQTWQVRDLPYLVFPNGWTLHTARPEAGRYLGNGINSSAGLRPATARRAPAFDPQTWQVGDLPYFSILMPVEKPLIYLVLGAAGSGRREVLVDLIAGGLETTDVPFVLLPAAEPPVDDDARLPNPQRWSLVEGFMVAPASGGATHVFVVTDGRANPMDQIEAFKAWLETTGGELARVLLVVNCQLAEKTPPLLPWFEACAHFADVLLLNRREGVANKWLSDFQNRFKDQYYPFLIEFVKAGRVKNPVLVLDPLARRMSHVFDEDQEWVVTSDEEGETENDIAEGDEEVEVTQEVDPYLDRDAANRRKKILPDIAKYLPPST